MREDFWIRKERKIVVDALRRAKSVRNPDTELIKHLEQCLQEPRAIP